MGEGMVLEFRRPSGSVRGPLIVAAVALVMGVGNLIREKSIWWSVPHLVFAALLVAIAIPSRQPYARVSEESLTLAALQERLGPRFVA